MAKEADKYFQVEPWRIVEKGFDPAHAQVAESIFSLGNEYMGIRGFFEEGYSGDRLVGSYFNGIYEQRIHPSSGYKGIANITEYMVNAVNWLDTKITADGEQLDLYKSRFMDFERILDMQTGLLSRRFIWETKSGARLWVSFERLLSMEQMTLGAQRIRIEALDGASGAAKVTVSLGLDGSTVHESVKANKWKALDGGQAGDDLYLKMETLTTKQQLYAQMHVSVTGKPEMSAQNEGCSGEGCSSDERDCIVLVDVPGKKVSKVYEWTLAPGNSLELERIVSCLVMRDAVDEEETAAFETGIEKASAQLAETNFTQLLQKNTAWWQHIWNGCDIEIQGDEENQQGIRFCIFQLFQTYRGVVKGSNIGAKGLTGEAYNGNAFWDTETYCLPFFLFNDMEGAKNLLYFRYRTLEAAKARARELDCEGAFYPIATISGLECCNLWQHASLQLQASTAVAYGIWFYRKMSGDDAFMAECGLEMLIEICRMLATRGDYSNDGSCYGFYNVMGPDEFQMMVNHNCYTNYMGKFTFEYTLQELVRMSREDPRALRSVVDKTRLTAQEQGEWEKMARLMYIPYDEKRRLFEQHKGFFELPHVDVDSIPVEDFPLYSHWSYDRIYRNDMIKQPDVLMLMLLFNSRFTQEQLRSNYEYYEPRCIHESSLSPSVHSILAGQLGKKQEAYDFFAFATRMDLDNYNRNSKEGIHTTSIAAAWMNIVYGFGGLRSDGDVPNLSPQIPKNWESYTFRLHLGGDVLQVHVDQEAVHVMTKQGRRVEFLLYGQAACADGEEKIYPIPEAWQ